MKHTFRRITQFLFLITTVATIYFTTRFIAHRYCPYAVVCYGVEGLHPAGSFKFVEAMTAGLIILVATIFIGRRFCGYICPFGTINEYLHYLNPFRKKISQIPYKIERKLRIGKYLLLLMNLVTVWIFVKRIYNNACPIMTIASLKKTVILVPGIFFLILIVLGNVIIPRFWCRYLCPYTALMNCSLFFGKLLKIRRPIIRRNLESCIDCYKCSERCQMNIDILSKEEIDDFNCVYCLECIRVCPKKNTLTG